ncbi:MAG TPA: nitroreductase family protein [Syntrophorhabdaceae bacterium]|nr:nitroreductase family protein [Syntrophorhabdaceae bacterium]
MDILKIMHERRSIRQYKQDPIPDEILLEILEAARVAPSWANTQVCRYIIVKDKAIKESLRDALSPTNPARDAFLQAPLVICQIAQRGVSGCKKGEPVTNKGDWFMFDAGIAMEHIVLAAWNFGLGTVHVGSFDAEKAEKILDIPEGFSIVEMTPVGYFDEVPKPTPRRPLNESIYLDLYGREYPIKK